MYKKGRSGNPKGRPRGIMDKRLKFADMLRAHGDKVIRKVLAMAEEGDIDAIKIIMDRISPKARIESTGITLPTKPDLEKLTAMKCELLQLALDGHIDADHLEKLSRTLDETYKVQTLSNNETSETKVTDPIEAARIYQRYIKG